MKISFSNIAWNFEDTDKICTLLKGYNFSALEIAPTIITPAPYTKNTNDIKDFAKSISSKYGFSISSMQSIWFGITGNIFNSQDTPTLIDYTKKIIDLASDINCPNLVFGCPKNRNMKKHDTPEKVIPFFKTIGDYAGEKDTCIALEANPTIYNTNFINTTKDAFAFAKAVNSKGLKVNVDLGTIIYNGESLEPLSKNPEFINHIHISEPNLVPIKKHEIHQKLYNLLKTTNYQNFISVEMKKPEKIGIIEEVAKYISETFN